MKINFQKTTLAAVLCVLVACSNANKDKGSYTDKQMRADSISQSSKSEQKAPAMERVANASTDTVSQNTKADKKEYVSSSAAKEDTRHPERKFIRTAELKFKVKNVIKATYAIEDIIGRNDGYITNTNLNSTIDNQTVIPMSEDSSLESTYFNVSNTVIARVPNTKLDSTLKAMASLVDYLDYRIIKADDVALQLRANELVQARNSRLHQRIINDIDKRGHKLPESTDAEENATNRQEAADNARLTNMSLVDQVKYSTINLTLYQHQEVKKLMIPNQKSTRAFEPSFGRRVGGALRTGWSVLEEILVFLTEIWWLLLIIGIAAVLVKRYHMKNKAK